MEALFAQFQQSLSQEFTTVSFNAQGEQGYARLAITEINNVPLDQAYEGYADLVAAGHSNLTQVLKQHRDIGVARLAAFLTPGFQYALAVVQKIQNSSKIGTKDKIRRQETTFIPHFLALY